MTSQYIQNSIKMFAMSRSLVLYLFQNDPGRTSTVVNDRIRRNTTIYMVPYYDRLSPCRIRRNTVIYGEKNDRLRSQYTEAIYGLRFAPFFSVYDRIAPYTGTEIYDRNTGPCNTTKYGRIRRNTDRVRSFTSVYGFRNRRPG